MIAATELRIGNWLLLLQPEDEIPDIKYQIDATDIGVCDSNGDRFGPIPLTPEILEKAGFKFEPGRFYLAAKLCIEDYDGLGTFVFSPTLTKLKYVHQLQNLYHAIRGEELQIISL